MGKRRVREGKEGSGRVEGVVWMGKRRVEKGRKGVDELKG